jgi:hypothetical protein
VSIDTDSLSSLSVMIVDGLDAAASGILDSYGTSHNILDSLGDARPVTERNERDLLFLTPGDKVYIELALRVSKGGYDIIRTHIGLGKQQVSLLGSREIGNTVTGVEHGRSVGQRRVLADLD